MEAMNKESRTDVEGSNLSTVNDTTNDSILIGCQKRKRLSGVVVLASGLPWFLPSRSAEPVEGDLTTASGS